MIQKKCIRNIVCETFRAHTGAIFKKLEILKVPDLVKFNSLCFINMKEIIFHLPLNTLSPLHPFLYCYTLPKTWNNLSLTLKRITTFNTFKKHLKKDIFDSYNM